MTAMTTAMTMKMTRTERPQLRAVQSQRATALGGFYTAQRGDYFLPFFFAAFFAGAFFFAAAMIHLSSVLRPLMRPLRNVGALGQPVEEGLYERSDTRCAARGSTPPRL
jgi:hypothetical protein